MRTLYVSAALFGVLASFGLGVVVGRFVIKNDDGMNAAQVAPDIGIFGATAETNGAIDANLDPAQMLPPPAAPNSPQKSIVSAEAVAVSARSEAEAFQSASKNCSISVSRAVPIKSWEQSGSVSAITEGENCGTSLVRILVKNPEGKTIFTMSAPAGDFGVAPSADAGELKAALARALPDSAIRAAAYPAWKEGDKAPNGTEFGREGYEAVRAANAPVICVKIPSAPQTCLAADPSSGEVKTLLRG